jgi:hypothetical protein
MKVVRLLAIFLIQQSLLCHHNHETELLATIIVSFLLSSSAYERVTLTNFKNELNQATCLTVVIIYFIGEVYNTNELKYNSQLWYSYKPIDM